MLKPSHSWGQTDVGGLEVVLATSVTHAHPLQPSLQVCAICERLLKASHHFLNVHSVHVSYRVSASLLEVALAAGRA